MKKIIHKSLSISKYDGVRILKGIFIGKEKSDQNMKKRGIFADKEKDE